MGRGVDLSLSTNPYGPPPYLRLALERGRREVRSYPDRTQSELTESLRRHLRVESREVLVAGSASELLRAAITAFGSGRSVLLAPHTYEEYRRVAASVRARVLPGPMSQLLIDPERWAARVRSESLVILANPGTPTGQYLTPREMGTLIDTVERRRSLLLVDESYLPFVPGAQSVAGTSGNLLTVFSWSKVLGTPGLPLGHAVGAPAVVRALRAHLVPWSVGPFARHLGLLALEHPAWMRTSLTRVELTASEVRPRLRSQSRTHYFLVRSRSGADLALQLRERGFYVRDLASMGLPQYVRFAVRRRAETRAFLATLADVERPSDRPARSGAGAVRQLREQNTKP